jgi:hypothetical protein
MRIRYYTSTSNARMSYFTGKMASSCKSNQLTILTSSPKALLSDFGTSEEMLKGKRERTGHTGTMAYMVR